MDPIYVTGHRNPDTDSIVAAISYAALRNACGEREYEAACLGRVSDETQIVLDRFGAQPPKRITDLYNQVRDLDFDKPPILSGGVTMGRAWDEFQAYPAIASIPVVNEDGTLYGVLSRSDIADYNMSRTNSGVLEEVPLFNAISVLEGKILNDAGENTDTISGEVTIALPQSRENLLFHSRESIVLCGNQPDMIRRALEMNVSCLVLCQTEISEELRTLPTKTCIISTPYDAFRAARLIFQSIPVGRICNTQGVVSFHLDDRVDTVRDMVLRYRHPSYPILDSNEKVVGILTRYHLLRPRRKQVVLVDHNEFAQSVPGLDQAEILEIIDHHRLADIQTAQPIHVRNEPVGSTNTIIAAMYQEHGVIPSGPMAGLMAAAILSDTVMFKSPTCTKRDISMAERLARIANIKLDDLGKELFASVSPDKPVQEMIASDFKEFHIAEQVLGVGQITCLDSLDIMSRKEELLREMNRIRDEHHYDMVLLMLTDVLLEGTQLLYVGSDDAIRNAFSVEPKDNTLFLPGVMSRKKQIIPMLTALWG